MLCQNRNIDYVLESKDLEINVTSRGNIKLAIDGSHKVFDNVKNVTLTRGRIIQIAFKDIQKFKEKRQQN